MVTKDSLLLAVKDASEKLEKAKSELLAFEASAENNRFDDADNAREVIEDKLRSYADADCEGAYNCGEETYTQRYYVGEVMYLCTAEFEYNRHDKTYYYVDGQSYTHEVVS